MTNELNERDEQIALFKRKEAHYEQTLQERDNLYKQDAMVRMQLNKRLEQVLMDKEEVQEKLDALQVSPGRYMSMLMSMSMSIVSGKQSACGMLESSMSNA